MNKTAKIILVISLLPPFIFLGYYFFSGVFSGKTRKEVFIEMMREENFSFRIDSIYRDNWNHNTLTMKGQKSSDIATSEREWENLFKVKDSIVKERDSLKIYIFRNKKIDTVLNYNDIRIR